MIYNIRKIFTILSVMVMGGVLVYNCEPEPDSLGEQLFLDGAANGTEKAYDLIAYNIKNNDSVRSDAFKLLDLVSSSSTSSRAVLGAFNENQFGMQRASYLTQVRLATYDPDFGTNAVVDSVVLVIKPVYRADSLKATTTDESYIYPDGNVDAKKVVNTYPITKFGKTKKSLTLEVREVTDFLGGYNDIVYSNKIFGTNSTVLGSKEITDGNVSSVTITKDSDNSSLFTSASPAIRINLTDAKTLFQTKIIDKKGQPELKDVSNFIRHFRGLKVSVNNNDGYLFQIHPNDMELIMYYKSDKDENGTNTRPQTKYAFDLKAANTHIGYYEYDRAGAEIQSYANGNTTTGDLKLYAQGMGGNSIGVKFPVATINKLKELYQTEKAAIISARIRIYTDKAKWSNSYPKPANSDFTIVQKDKDAEGKSTTSFTTDYTSLGATFIPVRAYDTDKDPAYYDFTVTQSLKDIVESTSNVDYSNKYFKIDLSQFLSNSSGALAGYSYTSRSFSPLRAVFVGSDPTNSDDDTTVTPNEIKLRVTFGTKK